MKWYIREGWTWVSVTGLGFVVAVVQSSYGSQGYSEPVQSHSLVGGGGLITCLILALCLEVESFKSSSIKVGGNTNLNYDLTSTWTLTDGTKHNETTVCTVTGVNNVTLGSVAGVCNCSHVHLRLCNVTSGNEGGYDLTWKNGNGPSEIKETWLVSVSSS